LRRQQLEHAAKVIHQGGIVAYPTESCFGLGCDPRNNAAICRLLHIKRRSYEQGLIVIGAGYNQIKMYIAYAENEIPAAVSDSWPGPHTWLLPARAGVSRWLRGEYLTIAVRVTAHGIAAALCRFAGKAIVSTSANRHGRAPARNSESVNKEFGELVDYILPGSIGNAIKPSEIRDAASGKVIRAA